MYPEGALKPCVSPRLSLSASFESTYTLYIYTLHTMKIYTKSGDRGRTGLHGGMRVDKDDPRIEANGCLDELNVAIGLLRARLDASHEWQAMLHDVQRTLMVVMSHVATPSAVRHTNPNVLPDDLATRCEAWIDAMTSLMADDEGYFILPGGTETSALCHQARVVARRAERRLCTLNKLDELPAQILSYVNRLSDLFFTMARYDLHLAGASEERWQAFGYKRKKRGEG